MAKRKVKKWLTSRDIKDVKCPTCWAGVGKPCSESGGPREKCHVERLKYALVIHGRLPLS
jgi:hypothetical protein